MAEDPVISVVIPVFNAAETLRATVGSVQAQSRSDWELLLIDDGSNDSSGAVMASLAAEDPRIKCLATPAQSGAGPARNVGLAAAKGRFIAFLDADDQWHPCKLELQLRAMAEMNQPFSCTAYLRRDAISGLETTFGVPNLASRSDLLKTNTIACSTVIYDSTFFGPRTMPDIRRRQDFALWLELLQVTPVVLGLNKILMTYRVHPKSLSGRKGQAAIDTWQMYQKLGLSPAKRAWVFGNYAVRGLVRHRWPGLALHLGWLHQVRDEV
ncbi:glycosyltransferase family 2 protein [Tabrizicola sp.]|uniref:glycosyltransferase family 2 protein n=1 Tax=Tabrizicola sp. TaxID=2005166 RepID=UPI003D2D3449